MSYVIRTDKRKHADYDSGARYYSRAFGCFSTLAQAKHYATFEDAQSKIRELRASAPSWFFHAVE